HHRRELRPRRAERPELGRRRGGEVGPRTSRAEAAVRLDRLPTFGEPADRPPVARPDLLSAGLHRGSESGRARVLRQILSRERHGRAARRRASGPRLMHRRFAGGLAIALLVLIAGVGIAFALGRYPVSLIDLGRVLLARITG